MTKKKNEVIFLKKKKEELGKGKTGGGGGGKGRTEEIQRLQRKDNTEAAFMTGLALLLLLLLSRFSHVRLCATPWTVAHQAPPFMGFSRQEYGSGVPLPSPGWGTKIPEISWHSQKIKGFLNK